MNSVMCTQSCTQKGIANSLRALGAVYEFTCKFFACTIRVVSFSYVGIVNIH